jgi:hypothetical protein
MRIPLLFCNVNLTESEADNVARGVDGIVQLYRSKIREIFFSGAQSYLVIIIVIIYFKVQPYLQISFLE